MSTKELYNKKILELAGKTSYFGKPESYNTVITAYNPLCGDKFIFYLEINDGIIEQAGFDGFGCTISKASSWVLTESLIGKEIAWLKQYLGCFLDAMQSDQDDSFNLNENQELFLPVKQYPERFECVTMSWSTLLEELQGSEKGKD